LAFTLLSTSPAFLQPKSFWDIWDVTDSLSFQETVLLRLIRCELSRLCYHSHSLLLSSYLCRIKQKENSTCSACGHPLQDLTHLLLDCPASEPLRRIIFGTTLLPFLISLVRTLGCGLTVGSLWSFSMPPSLGRGQVASPPSLNREGET